MDDTAVVPGRATAADRFLRLLARLVALAVIAQTVVQLLNLTILDRRIALLEVESDGSLWAWLSSSAMVVAAAGVALLGLLDGRHRWRLLLLAAILAFLSADDILAIHERISIDELGPIPSPSRIVWILAFTPVLVVALWLLRWWAGTTTHDIARFVWLGLAMLGGALVLEFTSPILFAIDLAKDSVAYKLEVIVEEGLELAGTGFLAGAILAEMLRTGRTWDPATDD